MKKNWSQERVKNGLLSFQGKYATISPNFLGKMLLFPVLTLLLRPSLPKIWLSHQHKNYTFEMSNNRAIR